MENRSYILNFQSPTSVFSGLAVAGLVDRMVTRNQEQLPIIPGSSVKGRWRFFAERLARAKPDNVSGPITLHQGDAHCKSSGNACTICKLFGNPAIPGLLWVGDAELDTETAREIKRLLARGANPVINHDTEIRPGIALSRVRRDALPGHLFFDEAVPAVTFTGDVMIREKLNKTEEQFFKASARLVDRIGGRKAVGRGTLANGIEFISGGAA